MQFNFFYDSGDLSQVVNDVVCSSALQFSARLRQATFPFGFGEILKVVERKANSVAGSRDADGPCASV
jgi:hypothetical protein